MVVQAATVIDEYLRTMEEVGRGLPRAEIQRAIDVLYDCWQREGTVFAAGNGGSAPPASHLACDLAKATIVPGRRRLKTIALVDNIPLNSAWTNDSGFASLFAEQLEPWLTERDGRGGPAGGGGPGAPAGRSCHRPERIRRRRPPPQRRSLHRRPHRFGAVGHACGRVLARCAAPPALHGVA